MRKIIYYLPAIICTVVIFILSTDAPSSEITINDKVGHFLAYFGLCTTWGWGIYKDRNQVLPINLILIILLVGTFYGIGLEIVQYQFFPNRFFEYGDILADFLGCLIGSISIRLFLR